MFITKYLYRNFCRRAIVALLCTWLLVPFCAAQVLHDNTQSPAQQAPAKSGPKKAGKRGPRALAVLEFLPGGHTRLVPVALWIDDRFYDASLYGANPAPMALEPETVYEATSYGQPTGLFTVTTPEEIKGSWVANGDWKPQLAMDEKIAQQAAKQPTPKAKGYDVNEERPVLRRPGSGDSSAGAQKSGEGNSGATQASAAPAKSSPEPPDRPTLTKPEASSDNPPAATTTSSATASPPRPSSTSASPDESDPNRPVLRRGAPTAQTPPETAAPTAMDKQVAAMESAQAKLATTMTSLGRRSYPAISDAGAYETRPLLYAMNSAERTGKSEQMRALALDAVGKFIATRKTPALPKNATISDYDLRAFDLDFSNSPTLVLTATLPVEGAKAVRGGAFEYFVTVVAREDINGTPVQIFSSVTDSNHLDAFPRMEIIDAVDADANGRGDLLFRQYSDSGISYALYRVYPYDLHKVFEGGASM
jgi:hypothetical protein